MNTQLETQNPEPLLRPAEALEQLDPALLDAARRALRTDEHGAEDLFQAMRTAVLEYRERGTVGFFRQRAVWAAKDWIKAQVRQQRREEAVIQAAKDRLGD